MQRRASIEAEHGADGAVEIRGGRNRPNARAREIGDVERGGQRLEQRGLGGEIVRRAGGAQGGAARVGAGCGRLR
ncbi:MAG: hypothetical protein WDM79_06690 [Terricaulis sp.]